MKVAHEEYAMRILYSLSSTLKGQGSLEVLVPRYLQQRVPLNRTPFQHGFYVDVLALIVNDDDVYVEVLSLTNYFCKQ